MRIEDCKIPREKPPSPPPEDVNHPPPAEMKYAEEAGALVPDSAARWRARGFILANYIQCSNKEKKMQEKDELLVYGPKTHPNTYPRKFIQKTLQIHRYLNQPTKHETSSACAAAGKTE